MKSRTTELIAKWRETAESCDQTGLEQDVVCGACLLNCADELEAALAESGAGPFHSDSQRILEEAKGLAQPATAKARETSAEEAAHDEWYEKSPYVESKSEASLAAWMERAGRGGQPSYEQVVKALNTTSYKPELSAHEVAKVLVEMSEHIKWRDPDADGHFQRLTERYNALLRSKSGGR